MTAEHPTAYPTYPTEENTMTTTTDPIFAHVYDPETEDLDLVDVSTWPLARKRQLREEAAAAGDDELTEALDANIAAEESGMTLSQLRHTMVVQLSTGGPGDQFEIEIERGRHGWELADTAATYRFLDWFDGATRRTNDADVNRRRRVVGVVADPQHLGWLESLVECLAED